MFSQPSADRTKQSLICKHLESISKKVSDEKIAKAMLRAEHSDGFIIGVEIQPFSPNENRYFQIYFNDIRLDQSSFQITPSVVFMNGTIKINPQGEILVSDNHYATDINARFFFENNALKMHDNVELLEQQSNRCTIL